MIRFHVDLDTSHEKTDPHRPPAIRLRGIHPPFTTWDTIMTEKRYNVVYLGDIRDGFDKARVLARICKLFSLDEAVGRKLLESANAVLKRGVDLETANRYAGALEQEGLRVRVAPTGARTEAASPPPSSEDRSLPFVAGTTAAIQEDVHYRKMEEGVARMAHQGSRKLAGSFWGSGGEYFRIWIVNLILTILTLGIYSAWAKVRRKQYFYGNTRIGSDTFRYLADPKRILVGRLIVTALFVVYSLTTRFAPEAATVMSLVFLIFFPWMIVKSFRFNAQNSMYRNIRFGFDGTVWGAIKAYILWPITIPLTLGILAPYVLFRQHAYYIGNSRYGTTRFQFRATGKDYYRMFFSLTVPVLMGFAACVGAYMLNPALVGIPVAIFYFFLFAWFSVKTTNIAFNSSRIAGSRITAELEVMEYALIVFTNTLFTALTLGLYHPWARVKAHNYRVSKLALIGASDLDQFVAAEEERVSALGEEVGDFFDFDMGI